MANSESSKPSFSSGRKWGIGVHVVLILFIALGIVGMLNYLSGRYFRRFYLSTDTRVELSPRTLNLLHSLTTHAQVTLYCDNKEALYGGNSDLLKRDHNHTTKVTVPTKACYASPADAEA